MISGLFKTMLHFTGSPRPLARATVVLCLFILPLNFARAEDPNCQLQKTPAAASRDLWVAGCVPVCTKMFKQDSAKAQAYFEKNCRRFAEQQGRPFSFADLTKAVGGVLDEALLQCLPQAGKKAVVGTYEFIKSLPQMLSYLLESVRSSTSKTAETWKQCSASPDCRRALARNTIAFQEKNPDGSWKVADSEVDRRIADTNFNELMLHAQHDHDLSFNDCSRSLGEIRRQVSADGEEWTPEKHQKVYDQLLKERPHCPGVLKLVPPSLAEAPAQRAEDQKESCLKNSPQPVSCLSMTEKMAVGSVCMGEDFDRDFEKMKVEFCSDVVQVLVPIPVVGPQTRFLPALAKTGRVAEAGEDVALSANLGAKATAPAELSRGAEAAEKFAAVGRSPRLTNFVDTYKESVFVNEAQNRRYIALAEDSTRTAAENKTRFFDVENSVMKKLNDSTNDKELVTSLTNFQKETFLSHVDQLKAKYPNLDFEVYSDFKSVKIAVKGQEQLSPELNAQLLKDLNEVYRDSNKAFAAKMDELGVKVAAAGDPATWFKAGYGRSVDEAALAARRARQSEGAAVMDYASEPVRGEMGVKLQQVEQERQALAGSAKFAPLLEGGPATALPKQDVFDLVRKNDSPEKLSAALSSRYHLKSFTPEDAKQLQDYVKGVDEFSPTILIAKRETVSLDAAAQGGASADFLGMGSANLQATAKGIMARKNLDEALAGARRGEQEVTATFKARMQKFKETVGGNVTCSGDDCVRVADSALGTKDKTRIMADLARNPDTRQVRMSFVGPGVPESARMQLASHGESIEKAFRKELEGKLDFSKLQSMTFGFDMATTQLNEGTVNLVIGKTPTTRLSGSEQKEIQAAFARALEKYNQDLRNYTQGSSRTSGPALKLIPGAGLLGVGQDN